MSNRMFGTSVSNAKPPITPLTCQKYNTKPPVRKLWQKENVNPEHYHENYFHNANLEDEKWDIIDSPQYVDFCNLIDARDSLFDNRRNVSTPLINAETKSSTLVQDCTLLSSFNNISISQAKQEETLNVFNNIDAGNNVEEEEKKQYVVHSVNHRQMTQGKDVNTQIPGWNINRPPISFTGSENSTASYRNNKVSEQGNKETCVAKANSVPKFSKAFTMPAITYGNAGKVEKSNKTEKPDKRKIEIWKRRPFVPCIPRRILERAKTPPLTTLVRAEERKRFDDAIKQKEKEKEEMKEMEALAKKKEEEEEMARLRKQTVHKAQPIRKYKPGLPNVKKRPLTEPISPITLKRRRRD